jgi:hypothetical protein
VGNLPGGLARRPCPAALPGGLARRPCPAALPGGLSRRPCPVALPGGLARQPYPAALPGSFARLPCINLITGRRPAELQAFLTAVGRHAALHSCSPAVYFKLTPQITVLVFFIILGVILTILLVRKYRKGKMKAYHPRFYTENDQISSGRQRGQKSTSTTFSDNLSMRTETTTDYQLGRINMITDADLYNLDDESDSYYGGSWRFEDNTPEGVQARKSIISRQLSGDPTKINPALSLNQQAKVLPYNPKFEISRSNFYIGMYQ